MMPLMLELTEIFGTADVIAWHDDRLLPYQGYQGYQCAVSRICGASLDLQQLWRHTAPDDALAPLLQGLLQLGFVFMQASTITASMGVIQLLQAARRWVHRRSCVTTRPCNLIHDPAVTAQAGAPYSFSWNAKHHQHYTCAGRC